MLKPFKTVLTSRNATLMLFAAIASTFGDWAYFLAISVFMTKHDALTLFATVATVRFGSTMLLAPFGGALVERWPKKLTMIVADLLRFLLMIFIAVEVTQGARGLWWIVALSSLSSLAGIVFAPARRALLPLTVDEGSRLALNAIDGSIGTVTLTLAPALAGLGLMAMSPAGVILANAFSFLASAAALMCLRDPSKAGETEEKKARFSLWSDTKEGLKFIAQTPDVAAVTGLAFVSHIAVGATWVLVPVIILRLGLPDSDTGYLSSTIGVGSMLGMFLGGTLAKGRELRIAFIAVSLFTVAMGLWALLQHSILGAFAGAALLGLTANIFEAPCWSILQNRTNQNLYARVFSAFDAIALLGMSLGTQASAVAVKALPLMSAIISIGGIMAAAFIATLARYLIQVRR